ncbi:PhoH family protein [Planctomyces sp. SH-PL14]|uniref:PhoH family protein n=1 Tax=Planctomyces sp. SH-PL14 TaxID=1632864 RepID=UPI00078E3023|nr:PhoH family protein [Planctomyces sp. SH-PL14]AMV17980.1 PhoH-like protein [Planctomyces sp. SH-PL14]
MPQANIPLTPDDDPSLLFGAQDVHVRRMRENLGVNIVLRGEQLILDGPEDRLPRAQEVINELLPLVRRKGILKDDDLSRVLGGSPGAKTPDAPTIDLLEKAKKVTPKTRGQEEYVDAIRKHDLVFCTGPAGCGKTYLAVAMAVNALRRQQVRKIVLVRPAVEAGERLGFLPGDLLAKVNPFLRPLLDSMNDMLDYEQVRRYMESDVIEIVPLAFMRGRTLNSTFIILDEGQNTTTTQMKMFLTRMGEGAKVVVTGDTTQTDLPPHVPSGLNDAIARLKHIDGVGVVALTGLDIVRHRLVREIVEAYDDEARRRKGRHGS